MTTNAERADTLVRTLQAGIDGDADTLKSLCAPDIRAWTPALSASTIDEVIDRLDERDGVFSNVTLDTTPLDVAGDRACVEWTATMTHTGAITLRDGTRIEPSAVVVALHGVAVAEFDGDRVASLRQYWDHTELFDQLGLIEPRDV